MPDSRSADEPYDLLVIGGGSAGSAAAAEAVKLGLKRVLVVNDGELGGLCILRGCMPTKTLLATSDLLHDLALAPELGVHVAEPRVDFGALMARKQRLVERFQRAKIASMEAAGYELLDGRARFVAHDAVQVGERRIAAKAFVIATGSRLHVPAEPDLDGVAYLHSDSSLELTALPRSLLIQGSGAVGLEFATLFSGLGVAVTLLSRSPLLNRGEDPELSQHMENALRACGVDVRIGAVIERFERAGGSKSSESTGGGESSAGGVRARVRQGEERYEIEAERYLLALGREANLEHLDLERAGIERDGAKLVLDTCLATTNPRVFAAGDATNGRQILHAGNMEGRHVARNAARLAAGEPLEAWIEEIPLFSIFTHPPYAECGLNETQARAAGLDVVSVRKSWANQGRGIVMGARVGGACAKLIAEKGSARLVGAQFLGPRADDLIHVATTLMHFRGSAEDLVAMPWYHPTLSEIYVELGRELLELAR